MNFINNFDKTKIVLLDDKKSFRIRYGGVNNIILKLKKVYAPFGIEKYNNKDILNLEYSIEDNLTNNFFSLIIELDEYFKELSNTKSEFINMNYVSPIKNITDKKIMLRTHLAKKINIKLKDNSKTFELKKATFNIELEFSTIWLYSNNYGIVLTVNMIDLT